MNTTELKIYKLLSYILLLPNAFNAIGILLAVFINPLQAILLLGIVLYTIHSFTFLIRGIINKNNCSFKLKLRIKYTSIAAIFFSVANFILWLTIIKNPSYLQQVSLPQNVKKMQGLSDADLEKLMEKVMLFISYVMLIYSALQMLHVFMTYKFTKLYADVFVEEKR